MQLNPSTSYSKQKSIALTPVNTTRSRLRALGMTSFNNVSNQDKALKQLQETVGHLFCYEKTPNEADVRVAIAKQWIRNQEFFSDQREFFRAADHDFLRTFWNKKNGLKKCYDGNRLTERRNELILGGLNTRIAESFFKWLKKLHADHEFEPFSVKRLGDLPFFTRAMDEELLTAVYNQEGLFMNENFIDWDVPWKLVELQTPHEEQLKWRFRNFKGNWSKLMYFFEAGEVLKQSRLQQFRERFSCSTGLAELPVKSSGKYIVEDQTFDAANYLCWVRLAQKGKVPERTLNLKYEVENYLMAFPLKSRGELLKRDKLKCIATSVESDWFCELDDSLQKKLIDIVLSADLKSKPSNEFLRHCDLKGIVEEKNTLIEESRKSLVEMGMLITGGIYRKPHMSLKEALLFQCVKQWESKHIQNFEAEKARKVLSNLQTLFRNGQRDKNELILNQNEILSMLEEDDKPSTRSQIKEPKETVFESNIQGYSSCYAKKFCWQKLTKEDWKKMLQVIYKADLYKNLHEDECWDFIINTSKVITGKSSTQIKLAFHEEILKNIGNYELDNTYLKYFSKVH